VRIEIGRRNRFSRVERRHQIIGRPAKDVAAEALQIGREIPAVTVVALNVMLRTS